jgi:hypothetical protein
MAGSSSGPFHLREIDDLAGSGGRPNNSPILTQIKVPTGGDFVLKPVTTRECEAADESGSVCTQHCCSNNCAQHPNQSPKLSVVRVLRWQRRGRNELRVYDISAMLGHGEWDRGLLQSEYAIRATTRAASIDEDKTLSVLNPQTQLRLTNWFRQLGDICRDPRASCEQLGCRLSRIVFSPREV